MVARENTDTSLDKMPAMSIPSEVFIMLSLVPINT